VEAALVLLDLADRSLQAHSRPRPLQLERPDLVVVEGALDEPRPSSAPVRVLPAWTMNRSWRLSALRNGEQTACQTWLFTPAERGKATSAR
jgi:hypothetical protein